MDHQLHSHELHSHGDAATTGSAVDPVCGMTVDPHKLRTGTPTVAGLITSARPAAAASLPADPEKYLDQRRRAPTGAGGHDLHLPDASGDPAGRAGRLPDLRHGARARARDGGQPAQSGARRHDAAASGSALALTVAGLRARDGRAPVRRACLGRARRCRTGCSSCSRRRWCCGRAGRSSCAAGARS